MNFLIISGNPKTDGLCKDITAHIERGARQGGADVEIITMEKVSRCNVCGDGWGTCSKQNVCEFGEVTPSGEADRFNSIQDKIKGADLLCFITPVYWGEVAEGLKAFMDRLRRCEFALFGGVGVLKGKQTLLVASPGGSGNGLLTCLQQMERFCQHTGAIVFDYIGINRWNQGYKKTAAYNAALLMAQGIKNGETTE
ncbi:MAG: flavodoxin family protein [Oscillospiraceae bacterium]|nr:flavodoxin family protein [Oscillospiraceae bacterium]